MLDNLTLHYGWWLLALLLIGAELLIPGYFLLWIGIAAAAMGLLLAFLPPLSMLTEAIGFAILAVVSCLIYWKFVRAVVDEPSQQPLLNRRGAQLVGRRLTLDSAIVNGQGKARVGDSFWLVAGPELPAGATVEVVGVDGTTLQVVAAS
jgi:membrane protein implicated in regulation of membrane protease activity